MKNNSFKSIICVGLLFGLGACTTPKIKTSDYEKPKIDEAQPIEKPISKTNEIDKDAINTQKKYVENDMIENADEAAAKAKLKAISIQEVGDRVYFPTDSFSLTPLAREVLAKQAHFLMARPNLKAVIAGNCDERGTREYNIALGARRANAVKDYLISLGVNPSQLSTVSYGKERPLDARPSLDGWAVNRNAQTKIQ